MKIKLEETFLSLILVLTIISHTFCFIPAELFNDVLVKFDKTSSTIELGKVSTTITHEEILRRGVIGSVTQFLIDNPRPGSQVSYTKVNLYYEVYIETL